MVGKANGGVTLSGKVGMSGKSNVCAPLLAHH